ncbi:MAG TPA: sigma 54-interacting transcriptional regulator [Gemmatimonadales bacterium]|nr:sigma 54-interacting transcriptional regulator [Gemmatimonadales bacterium]
MPGVTGKPTETRQRVDGAPEAQRYEALLKASEALAQHCELPPLLEALPGELRGLVTFDAMYLLLHDAGAPHIRVHLLDGVSPASYRELAADCSVAGWSLGRRDPVVVHPIEHDHIDVALRQLLPGLRVASVCTLPLNAAHRALGAVAFASRDARTFDATQLPFLELVAAQVSFAIDNVVGWQGAKVRQELQAQAASRLRRHEEQWRAVFENSAVGVALATPDGRFRAANRAFEQLLGYTEFELLTLTVLDVTHEEHRASTVARIGELLRGECEQFQMEKQVRRRDGSTIWVRNTVSLVPSAGDTPCALMAVSENITERKRTDEALRLSEERWRTLLEINNAIITHLTQGPLLHSVADSLGRIIPFDRAAFTLYNPERATFRYLAMEGSLASEYFRAGTEFHRSLTISGDVFDRQRGRLRRDLVTEQQYDNDRRLVAEGVRSDCVVPLIVGGRSIGTQNIGSRTVGRYTEADLALLQEIGNQVALAVENMQSYEAIAALQARLEKENVYLQEEIRTEHNFEEIVGSSPALVAVLHNLEQVARTDATVLICGETGTGKELIARAIHARSPRCDRPLVKVNCSAISAGLVESELFGHVKGAFTGATERRIGRFELADGGTIFLDEVGELPLETQVKLLRVLQEQEFEPVGSSRSLRVDVRVIAATNRHLPEAVRAGIFRSDLFYRLNVFPLDLPALRDRRSDIPQLANFFVSHCAKKLGKSMTGISRAAMDALVAYGWPGNVRELQNVIERAIILARGPVLESEPDLVSMLLPTPSPRMPGVAEAVQMPTEATAPFATLQDVERLHILEALKRSRGVVEGTHGAARMLNLHPNTLRHRMDKLGIKRAAFHQS